jgi:hypothetical protein
MMGEQLMSRKSILISLMLIMGLSALVAIVSGVATEPSALAQRATATPDATAEVTVMATSDGSLANWESLPQQIIDGRAFRHYATVSRSDGTYRQMYIDEAALETWELGQPLPEAAFIVMETYYSPEVESTNFTKQMTADGFQYGSFSPERPTFNVRPNASCTSCHSGAVDPAGTFTLPMLARAVEDGRVAVTTCDRGGRSPCAADVYDDLVTYLTEGM